MTQNYFYLSWNVNNRTKSSTPSSKPCRDQGFTTCPRHVVCFEFCDGREYFSSSQRRLLLIRRLFTIGEAYKLTLSLVREHSSRVSPSNAMSNSTQVSQGDAEFFFISSVVFYVFSLVRHAYSIVNIVSLGIISSYLQLVSKAHLSVTSLPAC